jgi:hypothetical protein
MPFLPHKKNVKLSGDLNPVSGRDKRREEIIMTMYIRLKRRNQTVFLHIDMADNFFKIKQRVAELYTMDPSNIQLIGSDKVGYRSSPFILLLSSTLEARVA